jgi:hypothetical protein
MTTIINNTKGDKTRSKKSVNVSSAGVEVEDNGDLSQKEFELLKESYKELLLVNSGFKTAIPASELWNN